MTVRTNFDRRYDKMLNEKTEFGYPCINCKYSLIKVPDELIINPDKNGRAGQAGFNVINLRNF